jgi:hypothetical protein
MLDYRPIAFVEKDREGLERRMTRLAECEKSLADHLRGRGLEEKNPPDPREIKDFVPMGQQLQCDLQCDLCCDVYKAVLTDREEALEGTWVDVLSLMVSLILLRSNNPIPYSLEERICDQRGSSARGTSLQTTPTKAKKTPKKQQPKQQQFQPLTLALSLALSLSRLSPSFSALNEVLKRTCCQLINTGFRLAEGLIKAYDKIGLRSMIRKLSFLTTSVVKREWPNGLAHEPLTIKCSGSTPTVEVKFLRESELKVPTSTPSADLSFLSDRSRLGRLFLKELSIKEPRIMSNWLDVMANWGCSYSNLDLGELLVKLFEQGNNLDGFLEENLHRSGQTESWSCYDGFLLLLGLPAGCVWFSRCREGSHSLFVRGKGGSQNAAAQQTQMEQDLKRVQSLLSSMTNQIATLEGKVKNQQIEIKGLESKTDAQEKELAAHKLASTQQVAVGANSSLQTANQTPVLVLGTDGVKFDRSELSKTVVNDLGKNIKRNFTNCDKLETILQYYLLAKAMNRVSVTVAWERFYHLLNSLNPSKEHFATLKTVYSSVDKSTVVDWKDAMSMLMRAAEPTMTEVALAARLKDIKFTSAMSYRLKIQETLLLIEMMGKTPPGKAELTKIVLSEIKTRDDHAMEELIQESSKNQSSITDLNALLWTEILDLMVTVERARSMRKSLTADDSSSDSSDSDFDTPQPKKNGGGRNAKRNKKQRKNKAKKKKQKTSKNSKPDKKVKSDKKGKEGKPGKKGRQPSDGLKCTRCGGPHKATDCWIESAKKPVVCRNCSKEGHLQKVCRSKPKKKAKTKKKSQDSDSDSDNSSSSSNLVIQQTGASDGSKQYDPLSLFNEIASKNEQFAEVVISNDKVKKPVLKAIFCGLSEHEVTCDTGTSLDLVDEAIICVLRNENEKKGNTNNQGYKPCKTSVRAAGGGNLIVKGQIWLTLDLGQGVTFSSVFVVVENLGVPALLGNWTMLRVGMQIVLKKPDPHILIDAKEGKTARFPIEMETAELISSYLVTYQSVKMGAIQRAEAPATLTSKPDFGGRGGG